MGETLDTLCRRVDKRGPSISTAWLVFGVLILAIPFRAQAATDVTVTGLTALDKVYDATTVASLSGVAMLSGIAPGDDVSLIGTPTAAFNDENVGVAKPVNVSGLSLSGADAGNYSLVPPVLAASITPAPLVVSGLIANNKIYDGTTAASLSGAASVTPLGSDSVSVSGTAIGAFDDANVGADKPVTVTGLVLTGADASNYTLAPLVLRASITAASLAIPTLGWPGLLGLALLLAGLAITKLLPSRR